MYLRTCSISYMHCTMVYGMLIKLQLQLQCLTFWDYNSMCNAMSVRGGTVK